MTNNNSQLIRIQYVADGELSEFFYTFRIFEAYNMEVYFDNILQSSGYEITNIGNKEGGSVIFNTPPPANIVITLARNLDADRQSEFQEGGELRARVLNKEFDYQVACLQQINSALDRIPSFPVYSKDINLEMPYPEAGKALKWNDNADGLTNSEMTIDAMQGVFEGYKNQAEASSVVAKEGSIIATNKAKEATDSANKASFEANRARDAANTVDYEQILRPRNTLISGSDNLLKIVNNTTLGFNVSADNPLIYSNDLGDELSLTSLGNIAFGDNPNYYVIENMTSNSLPEGYSCSSTQNSNNVWVAFDGNEKSRWTLNGANYGVYSANYNLPQKQKFKGFYFNTHYQIYDCYGVHGYKVSYYDDVSEAWVVLHDALDADFDGTVTILKECETRQFKLEFKNWELYGTTSGIFLFRPLPKEPGYTNEKINVYLDTVGQYATTEYAEGRLLIGRATFDNNSYLTAVESVARANEYLNNNFMNYAPGARAEVGRWGKASNESINLSIPTANVATNFVAPANGVYVIKIGTSAGVYEIYNNNNGVGSADYGSAANNQGFLSVRKGDVVSLKYTGSLEFAKFYYDEGEV